MLRYLKNNGFPVDLEFQTDPYHSDDDDFHGFKSEIFVDGNHFTDLIHSNYRDRVHYANGFLAAYEWEGKGKYKWRGKEIPYRKDGNLDIEVGDWIVDIPGKVRKVQNDNDPDMPYKSIIRFASEIEVENSDKINELIDLLNEIKRYNESAWDTYGSELCAGEMIGEERTIKKKIDELRIESEIEEMEEK
jgi:hypothetical protein